MSLKSRLRALRTCAADQRGGIAILSAVFLMVGVAVAALAVDLGSLHLERRAAQGATDLAAIAASRDLDHAEAAAKATLNANGISDITNLSVERGVYLPDPALAPDRRFTPGKTPYNAARVTVERTGKLYFARAIRKDPMKMRVSATAATSAVAAFSVGSRLAAVRDGVANALLGGLLGGNVALSVADYEALASADIDMFQFMNALATELNVTAGTYNDVLQSSATVGDVLAAAAAVTNSNGNPAATTAVNKLLQQSTAASRSVPLSQYFDLGPLGDLAAGTPAPGLDANFRVMELVTGAATLANGAHQATVNLGATVPGLLSLKLDIAVGEPPQSSAWAAVGEEGSTARTAQIRMRLVAEVGGSGVLLGAKVRLPIAVDLAYAEARLAKIACSQDGSGAVDVAAQPGVAELWIGELSSQAMADFSQRPTATAAKIVDTALIKVTGLAHIAVGSTSETTLTFLQSDIDAGELKRVNSTNMAQSVVASLLGDLKLNVKVGGLGLALPSAVTAAVKAVLEPVAAPIDAVIDSLLQTLGVSVGEADVKVHGVRCGTSILAG
ncbi:MAG: TadG family pilus assembly protein [Hyphomicrobium sp.]